MKVEDRKAKEENEAKKEKIEFEKLKELEDQRINIKYLNNKIDDFLLPTSLEEFRTEIKKIFQIEKNNEDIFIVYSIMEKIDKKDKEKIIEINKVKEYIDLLEKIKSDQIVDDIIYIETDRVPEEISREIPETFEEEIQCLIETHLKAATERIKRGLSGKDEINLSSNKNTKQCSKCAKRIYGSIYRVVNDNEQKIYCSKCSLSNNGPMFIINN